MKNIIFIFIAFLLLLVSYLFRGIGNIPSLLIYSSANDFFDFSDIIIFQISSSFLTVAFMSMIGDKSEKNVYGTNLSEYILSRQLLGSWSNIAFLITVFSAVNFINFMLCLNSLIIWYMIAGLLLLVWLIKKISQLFFNSVKIEERILSDYKAYIECRLSERKEAFISGDLKKLYLYTKEGLYNNSFNTVKENLEIYSLLICHSINLDKSSFSEPLIRKNQIRTKEAVMHLALLIEECKTEKVDRNDLVIDSVLYFLRLYFSDRECDDKSIHLLHEALGGYCNQILQNNFDIPFNKAFDFSLVHFLCEGDSDKKLNHGSLEAVKYIAATKPSSLSNRDYQEWTPFLEACEYGQYEIIEFLISRKMKDEINHMDKNNITPLETAFVNNNISIVKLLLENGADLSKVNPIYRKDIENNRFK